MTVLHTFSRLTLAACILTSCGGAPNTPSEAPSQALSTLNQGILPGSKGERLPILPGSKGDRLPVLNVEMTLPQSAFSQTDFGVKALADDLLHDLRGWRVVINGVPVTVEWLGVRVLGDTFSVTFQAQAESPEAAFFSTTIYNEADLLRAAALVPAPVEKSWRAEVSLTSTAVWLAAEKRQKAKAAPLESISPEEVAEIEADPVVAEITADLREAYQQKKADTDVRQTASLESRLRGLLAELLKRFGKSSQASGKPPQLTSEDDRHSGHGHGNGGNEDDDEQDKDNGKGRSKGKQK